MAVIDLEEATIKVWDGSLRLITMDSTNSDADLICTEISRHNGSYPPNLTFVDPSANSAALSVVVTGRDIVVNLATGVGGAIESTAAEIAAAITAADATLITMTYDTVGAGIVEAIAKTSLAGTKNSLEVKLGSGNVTFTGKKPREFRLNRNVLDTVRNAAQEPMDVAFAAEWEFIRGVSGASIPTIMETLLQVGGASAWVSTATDQCQPYCIDLEILNAPNCSGIENESILFPEFYYETRPGDLQAGNFSIAGRSNATEEIAIRIPA